MPPPAFLFLMAVLVAILIFRRPIRKYLTRKRTPERDPIEENALASVKENGGVYFSGEMFGQPSRRHLK